MCVLIKNGTYKGIKCPALILKKLKKKQTENRVIR